MPADAGPAQLLADAGWLRLLAQRLAGGADGDDVAQEAMLVALGKPRPAGEGLRPWLVVTARNLLRRRRRDERRLQARHAALEAPEPAATAEAALERLDTLRVVAELVRALPDPYRATVLARYFEGKSAVQIAAETGVPEGTVRWRLKEGLDRLRVELDRRHGGDRRRWSLLFLPPARRGLAVGGALAASLALVAGLTAVAVAGRHPLGLGAVGLAASGPSSATPSAARPPRLAAGIAAPGEGAVTGVVRDPAGRPVAGAAVVLFPTRATTLAVDPARVDGLEGWTASDAEGRFLFEGRLPGAYVLTAAHERFGPAEAPVSIGAGERPRVELRLTTAGELLSGTVRDSGAGPLVGVRVTAVEFPGRGQQLHFGTTSGAAGRYALRLPRGHWHVSASADGYAYSWAEVAIEGATVSDLALSAAGAIAGRVVDAATGAPMAGATVRLDRPGTPAGRTTTTGIAGFFSFGSTWPAGPYRLTASAGEGVARLEVPHSDPAARASVELALRPGLAVAGRVTDGRGRSLAGAAVQLFEIPRQIQPVRQVKTDGDGRYRIAGLPAGAAWIGAEASGRAPERRPVVPSAGAVADLALGEEATLAGVVTREDGRPAGGAELRLTLLASADPAAPLLAFRRLPLDGQGRFRIEALAAGAFAADVQTRGEGAGHFSGVLGRGEHRTVTWRLSGPLAPDGRGCDAVVVGPF